MAGTPRRLVVRVAGLQGAQPDEARVIKGPLVAPIDAFFRQVFVMVEDERVRRNRLALLQRVAGLTTGIADLTQLRG